MSLGIQNNYYSESSMVSAIRKQERKRKLLQSNYILMRLIKAQETKVMTPEEEMEVFKKSFMPNWKGY